MSKFEINRITVELIRAIFRFCFFFRPPKLSPNNIQIIFEPRPPNFENQYNF